VIPCVPCITDGQPVHPDPPPDVYDQLLALLMHLDVDERAPVHLTAVGNAFVTGAPVHTEQEE
jgi:hypothetical protein